MPFESKLHMARLRSGIIDMTWLRGFCLPDKDATSMNSKLGVRELMLESEAQGPSKSLATDWAAAGFKDTELGVLMRPGVALIAVGRVRRLRVGSSRSEQREYLNSVSIFARLGEPIRARTREDRKRSYSRAAFFSFPRTQSHSFSGHKSVTF